MLSSEKILFGAHDSEHATSVWLVVHRQKCDRESTTDCALGQDAKHISTPLVEELVNDIRTDDCIVKINQYQAH